ncbi:cobalt-zinc-cadmium efflux system protein [Streptohalobacillus salinus]|uniref:Cobalt-zinc-cadmium efflux system protein n=1 Tax=Streptohalobacillus salinus TaxID=621096 RepID=A0A2V3WCZ8_9BACI|nr:cation diffusion facilitator family transporter [Streptohalobacillus salinus]PXW90998.1 cobalt-zinc-cadmium efflux system protein [Streptohalobacillus salinus]
MGHNHEHDHHNQTGNIKVAFFLNVSFTIIEIIGGLLTNSMAILSDALHDLGDSLSLGIAWFLEKVAGKKPDDTFTFGYARFSLLGAFINSVVIVVGSILILYHAIPRLLNPEPVEATGMFFLAILGIVINGLAVIRLKKGSSINEKVVSWHLMEDVLGWAVLLVASIVLMFVDWPILDPILSLGITAYILYNVVMNLKDILAIFLQRAPKGIDRDALQQILKEKLALDTHHVHLWTLDGERIMMSVHLEVDDNQSSDDLIETKKHVREILHDEGIDHVTIELEFKREKCQSKDCC